LARRCHDTWVRFLLSLLDVTQRLCRADVLILECGEDVRGGRHGVRDESLLLPSWEASPASSVAPTALQNYSFTISDRSNGEARHFICSKQFDVLDWVAKINTAVAMRVRKEQVCTRPSVAALLTALCQCLRAVVLFLGLARYRRSACMQVAGLPSVFVWML
jgi:hypothetical protein